MADLFRKALDKGKSSSLREEINEFTLIEHDKVRDILKSSTEYHDTKVCRFRKQKLQFQD